MTAAERKVRERYGASVEFYKYPALGMAHVWATVDGKRQIVGRAETPRRAWADAASRLPALENEQ